MYARTTYALGDPAQIEHSIEGLRTEAPKLLADCPGYRSFGLFADREQGKIAMASWWETENDRANSDARLGERRGELLTPFADSITVDNFEVAAYTEDADLAAASAFRLGRFMIDPAQIDELIGAFQGYGLPRMRDLSGFCGAALFVNREHGYGGVGTLFADRAALAASRTPQSLARREAVRRTGMRVLSMEELEVILVEENPEAPH